MQTFKSIKGGTEEELFDKFPWLKTCQFRNIEIDMGNSYIIWKDGVWEDGVWKNGVWEDGVWEDGVWKNGVWKNGLMWSNIDQQYIKIKKWENNKFIF